MIKLLFASMLSVTLGLPLIGCSSSGDGSNDLVDPSFFITEAGNSGNGGGNSSLLNGRHAVDLGSLELIQSTPIDYDLRTPQVLYGASDSATGVICVSTLTILSNNAGANANYTALIENNLALDDSIFTISIKDIPGPTNIVGIEYSYGFEINATSYTTLMHAHYLPAQDVTFSNPALTSLECGSPTNGYGLNESHIRAILDSVVYLRGN